MIPTAIHFLVGVAVVGGMLWGAAALARRFGARGANPGPAGTGLRIVARRPISKGSSLLRISVDDRDLLVGASPKGIELLCDLPKTAPVPLPATTDSPPMIANLAASWKRRGFPPAPRADGYSLLSPLSEEDTQGGFAGMLRTATSRRRTGPQA